MLLPSHVRIKHSRLSNEFKDLLYVFVHAAGSSDRALTLMCFETMILLDKGTFYLYLCIFVFALLNFNQCLHDTSYGYI